MKRYGMRECRNNLPQFSLGHYTRTDGIHVWQPHVQGSPLIKETIDEDFAREQLEKAWGNHRGPAVMVEWDGDTSTETTIKVK